MSRPERAARPEAASSVGPVASGYERSLRPCLGTSITLRSTKEVPPIPPSTRAPRADEAEELYRRYRETALVAYRHIFPPELYPFPDEAVRATWRDLVRDHGRTHRLVVADSDGEVVGAVVARPGTLENLFVVPPHWGTGVADLLHAAAVDVSRDAGAAECRLEVLEENGRARRFYERHGWARDGRSRAGEYPPYPRVVGYTLVL